MEIAAALMKMGLPDEQEQNVPDDLNETYDRYEQGDRRSGGYGGGGYGGGEIRSIANGRVRLFINAGHAEHNPQRPGGRHCRRISMPGKMIGDFR